MSSDIYVFGASMTPFGKFMERSVKSLVAEAVSGALSDAGAAVSDVDAAFYSNTTQSIMEGQHLIRGQIALRGFGFTGIPIVNVENACASGSTAFHQAVMQLRAGAADVALAVGVEKMYDDDRVKSSAVFDGGWDVHEKDNVARSLAAIGEGVETPPDRGSGVRSPFIELYASLAKGHMKMFGTTERHLAAVAAKNHHHSTMNPLSQYQHDMTADEVLAGRMVAWPLTLPMCSPISDGAAAAVLCTKAGLRRLNTTRAIRVLASVLASGSDRDWANFEHGACRLAALKAYELAGVGPNDVDVCEVHDASAFGELIQTENLGLCAQGEGGPLADSGVTALGGRVPVNPSGGLESKGHPIGATGLGQLYELVTQLRGEAGARQVEGARIAVAENGGGFLGVEEAAVAVTILGC
jgi:acetyl-CoA acyltransferase